MTAQSYSTASVSAHFLSLDHLDDYLPNLLLVCSKGCGIAVQEPEEIIFENSPSFDCVVHLKKDNEEIKS